MRCYTAAENGTRQVICFDEFGPLEIRPHPGVDWAPQKKVRRLSATYTRKQGVRYFLGAYDVNRDQLWGLFYEHQTQVEVLNFYQDIRRHYPANVHLYLVLDNRSAHTTPMLLDWIAHNNITLVLTPTNASHLNRIESQLTPIRKFALSGRHFKDHDEQNTAILDYVAYRNQLTQKPTARHRDIRVNLS
jgi:DDE superfamily endonuclease